jgi:hypothetical protein
MIMFQGDVSAVIDGAGTEEPDAGLRPRRGKQKQKQKQSSGYPSVRPAVIEY